MINKKDVSILYLLIFLEILILLNSQIVINSVFYSTKIFVFSVFPSLFPNMLIGNLLIKTGIEEIIPEFINKLFNKLFNFNKTCTGIFIMSLVCGSPSNAIFINEALNNNKIDLKEAQNLLCVTHFINPLFVVAMIGNNLFNSSKIGIIILLIMLTSNLIKAFILRNNFKSNNINKIKENKNNFITNMQESIKTSINALLLILGIIITFNILISLISNIFILTPKINCLITGILEMTSGIAKLKYININPLLKLLISYIFINFGGISIQMQTLNMFQNKKIKYFKYFIFRLF